MSAPRGRLVVVGSGIQLGRHISERAVSEIRHADCVACMVDPLALAWIRELKPGAINLARFYATGKDRRETYREMEAAILAPLSDGCRVCAVFYGHPGVFADVPHRAVARARELGHEARMEPGISAADCLYADLGLDPGRRGVQSYEATHFLLHDRVIDPAALVLLWQVGLAGELSLKRFDTTPDRLAVLVDKLARWYPRATEAILYEAAESPITSFRAERLALSDLPRARLSESTTLVIPPAQAPARDLRIEGLLGGLQQAS